MRRHVQSILATILMMVVCTTAIAQTSRSSIQTNNSQGASDEQLISRMVDEIKAGRETVAAQDAQIEALQRQVEIEKANSASLTKSYEASQREINTLRRSNDLLEKAISLHEQTIAIVTKDRDDAKQSARKARKQAAGATIVAIILGALKFL